jgi:hypothetical protein
MGMQVEIVEINTYVYLSGNKHKVYTVTQTETHQHRVGEVSTFRTFVTMLECDAEGNELGNDPIRVNADEITEM